MSTTEKKGVVDGVPLPLERSERTAAEQSLFRGEPIEWLTVPTTKTVVTGNAFGDDEISERPSRREQWILFCSNRYKKEDFYKMAFP